MSKEKRYIEISELPNYEITADAKSGPITEEVKFVMLPYEHLYDIPPADVKEVVHGYWIITDTPLGRCCICSVCGSCLTMDYKYCPYCGTIMDLEAKYDNE